MTAPADNYSVLIGPINGGFAPSLYAWAVALATDAWTALSAQTFSSWVTANIPPGAYLGNDPYGAGVNAYGAPGYILGKKRYRNGGHTDSSNDGTVLFDEQTLTYSWEQLPTPPSKYPPPYVSTGSDLYPSGAAGLGFARNDLTDSLDIAYNSPRSRRATHSYGAWVMSGGKLRIYYLTPGEFDTVALTWNTAVIDIGAQLTAFNVNYSAAYLQQGTVAHYDSGTDRDYVTLVPGDAGISWRSSIIQVHPTTHVVELVHDMVASTYNVRESSSVVQVGRKLYVFSKLSADTTDMNHGFIFDMDAKTHTFFNIIGDLAGGILDANSGANMECIPACYYASKGLILRYNYRTTERAHAYTVNPTPESGAGTSGNPYLLRQTVRNIGGAIPSAFGYIYRLDYNSAADCVVLIPKSTVVPSALKLA